MSVDKELTVELSDVLDEILQANENPSFADLDEWIAKYPQFERELLEFAAFQSTLKHVPEPKDILTSAESANARRSLVRDIVNGAVSKSTTEQEELKSFSAKAKELGLKFPQLAQKIGLSLPLLANLEQRFVLYRSVPKEIIEKISEALKVPVKAIESYLQLPPALTTQASFKAADKPEIAPEQEDFFILVERDLMLQPVQKNELLKMKK